MESRWRILGAVYLESDWKSAMKRGAGRRGPSSGGVGRIWTAEILGGFWRSDVPLMLDLYLGFPRPPTENGLSAS